MFKYLILIIMFFVTSVASAADYYLFIFSTNNCKYCDLEKADIKKNKEFQSKFKEIIEIHVYDEYSIHYDDDEENGFLKMFITIRSIKNPKFVHNIWTYTSRQSIFRAANSVNTYPNTLVLKLNKNNKLYALDSVSGYNKATFNNQIDKIIKNDK